MSLSYLYPHSTVTWGSMPLSDKVIDLVAMISFVIVAWKFEGKSHWGWLERSIKLFPLVLLWFFLLIGLHYLWQDVIRPMFR
jgi:hypothetical protein